MNNESNHEVHLKGWGHELWIVNNELYCGKILYFEKEKRCSFHYHKIKTETFYLQSGKVQIFYSEEDDLIIAENITLFPGDSFNIPIGLRHQVLALEESVLFEFSTKHRENDSYRILRGD
jgi:mannose-6-phosphate isomerase-like protein (cupin superfamily)